MSISDIKSGIKKERAAYAAAAVLTFLFGTVYELFSHNVDSPFMRFAWIIPVIGLAANEIVRALSCASLHRDILAGAVIWFTLGSIFKGVLDIYGTTNKLIFVFPAAGVLQILLLAVLVIKKRQTA